nr:Hsp20/alpha crystallin family protein [Gammaproteobacteria bacterium]
MPAPITKLMHSLLTQSSAYQTCPWQPLVDVYRGTRGWLVKLDLAGVKVEDVELHISGRQLTVQGLRRDCSIVEGQQAYSMEIAYNRFQRSIELPSDIEGAQILTEYDNGMLLVHLAIESSTSS